MVVQWYAKIDCGCGKGLVRKPVAGETLTPEELEALKEEFATEYADHCKWCHSSTYYGEPPSILQHQQQQPQQPHTQQPQYVPPPPPAGQLQLQLQYVPPPPGSPPAKNGKRKLQDDTAGGKHAKVEYERPTTPGESTAGISPLRCPSPVGFPAFFVEVGPWAGAPGPLGLWAPGPLGHWAPGPLGPWAPGPLGPWTPWPLSH